jgi:PAS domain S-box-containing protein
MSTLTTPENSDLFRAFFEHSADSILLLENGIFTDCNQATVQMMRARDKAEFLSQHPSKLSPKFQPDGRPSGEKADEMIRLALEKGSNRFEWIHRRIDGVDIPVEVLLTPIMIGDRQVIHTVWRDISERKAAEKALEVSEAQFHSFFEQSADAILLLENGIFTDCNQATVKLMRALDKAQFLSLHPSKLSPEFQPDGRPSGEKADEMIKIALDKGSNRFEWVHRRVDGTDIPVEVLLTPILLGERQVIYTVWRDISERKRLQAEVQASLERRERQVQLSTRVSQDLASATALEEVYERVVTQVKELFNYYHTQLLRYDEAQNAVVLITGYGETGQKMLAAKHRMPLGAGLIGTAAATGQTVLRPSLRDDPDWQPNPLLPETKGEIAVPIKLGEAILGVLDVQSSEANALSADDQILLEGLCGQIAIAIESTRLRQEMNERIEETTRLYQAMSREGWQAYRQTENLPSGFIYDKMNVSPIPETGLAEELFATIPIIAPGGETVGALEVEDDPQRPFLEEDMVFLQQIAEQVALALESARLFDQTQSALAQSERLFVASRSLTQAADLQGLVKTVVETMNIPRINRAVLGLFSYGPTGELETMQIAANWWNGTGREPTKVGTTYPFETFRAFALFLNPGPVFFDDAFNDQRADPVTLQLVKDLNIRAVASLPLYLGARQIGVLLLEAEEIHHFTQEESRLFSALAPQITTVLENRRQFERAQLQAAREAALNVISQKIQSATTVEAVLQIAARELGHALGAPRTIAQLSLKDKK